MKLNAASRLRASPAYTEVRELVIAILNHTGFPTKGVSAQRKVDRDLLPELESDVGRNGILILEDFLQKDVSSKTWQPLISGQSNHLPSSVRATFDEMYSSIMYWVEEDND